VIKSNLDPEDTGELKIDILLGNLKLINRKLDTIKDNLKEIQEFVEMNDLDFMKKFKEKDKDQNNYLPPKVFLKVLKKNGVVIEESEQKEIIKIYSDQGKEEVYYQFFIQDLRKY